MKLPEGIEPEPILVGMPAGQSEETIRAAFRERFARDIARARAEVPTHPYWAAYTEGDLRFADACADSLMAFVYKSLPKQHALQEHVLARLLRQVDAWPAGAAANIVQTPWYQDGTFLGAINVGMLSEQISTRKVGWPGDAAPNDVLRWMAEHGDDDVKQFGRVMLERAERDGWLPVNVVNLSTGKRVEHDDDAEAMRTSGANYRVTIDSNGYKLMGFALVYLAWRDVIEDARTALGAARLAWSAVHNDDEDTLSVMARGALAEAKHAATDPDAVRELVAELRAVLPLALDAAHFTGDAPSSEAEATATEAGILRWDEGFARYLDELGEQGKAIASKVRENARARFATYEAKADRSRAGGALWTLWSDVDQRPACLRFGRTLAYALWVEKVRKRLDEAKRKPAGLTRAVTVDVLDLYSRRYEPEDRNGQRALVFPEQRGWVLVPSIVDGALSGILSRGVDLLTSELGIDLLEWEVTEAHKRYVSGDHDFRRLAVEGGWSALAHEQLGAAGKKAAEHVRAIVLAQAHLRFESFGFTGNLLSYAEPRKHAPGQRALVTITLGDMLLAGFANALREEHGASSLTSREGRRLVPILGKTALVGRNRDHAAQRRMVWRFAVALRDRAEELAKDGAVRMPMATWTMLASEAGAPRSGTFLSNVLDAWRKGDAEAPPLIEQSGDQVTLHASRKAALEFLVAGGKLSIRKRADGKAAARGRAKGWRSK